MKRIAFPVIAIMLGAGIGLAMAEVGLRLFGIGFGSAPLEPHPILHHVHPKEYSFLSYTPTGNYENVVVYYDNEGLRTYPDPRLRPLKSAINDCRIAFLGDSFTEALQVSYEMTFVGRLDTQSKCHIKNYGVSSYSPALYLVQWRESVRQFKPSLVIVQLYSNDIDGDADFLKSAKFDSDGRIVAILGPEGIRITQALRNLYVARFVRMSQIRITWWLENFGKTKNVVAGFAEHDPDISFVSATLMKQLTHEISKDGAELALFVVPSYYRLSSPQAEFRSPEFSDKWNKWAIENNVKFIDLRESFRASVDQGHMPFFSVDIHFNEIGHEIVAGQICRHFPGYFLKPCDRQH